MLTKEKMKQIEEEEKYRSTVRKQFSDFDLSKKSKFTAALLAIFLGSLGIHKFYIGSNKIGIVYLLFFWTGIPTIVGVLEGISYLSMSEKQFQSKCSLPNKEDPKKESKLHKVLGIIVVLLILGGLLPALLIK